MLRIPANLIQKAEKLTQKHSDDQVLRLRNGKLLAGKFKGTGFQRFRGMLVKIFWPPTSWKKEYLMAKQAEYADISFQEEAAFARALSKNISSRTTKGYKTSSSLMVDDVRELLEHSKQDRKEFDDTVKNLTSALTSPSPLVRDPLRGAESVVNKAVERKFLCRVAQMQQLQKEVDEILSKAGVKKATISKLDEAIDDYTIKLSLFNVAREYARRAYSPPVTWDGSPNPYPVKEDSQPTSPELNLETHQDELADSLNTGVQEAPLDSSLLTSEAASLSKEPASDQTDDELPSFTSETTPDSLDNEITESSGALPEEDWMQQGPYPHNPGKDIDADWELKRTLKDDQRKATLKSQSVADLAADQLYPMADELIDLADLPRDISDRTRKTMQLRKIDEPWSKEVIRLLEENTLESDKKALLLEQTHRRSQNHRELQKEKTEAVKQMKSFWASRRWDAVLKVEKLEDQLGGKDSSNFPQHYRDLASKTISKPLHYDNVQLPMNEAIDRTITMLKNAYPTLADRGNAFREEELREHLQDYLSQRAIVPVDVPTTTYVTTPLVEEEALLSEAFTDAPPNESLEFDHMAVAPSKGKEDDRVSVTDSAIYSETSTGSDEQDLNGYNLEDYPSIGEPKPFLKEGQDDAELFSSETTEKANSDHFIPPLNSTEPPEDQST